IDLENFHEDACCLPVRFITCIFYFNFRKKPLNCAFSLKACLQTFITQEKNSKPFFEHKRVVFLCIEEAYHIPARKTLG
ncbi:hypothetical protein ACJX0J_033250, partial [Zea mays]